MGVVPGTLLTMAEMVRIGRDIYRRMLACSSLKTCQKKKSCGWIGREGIDDVNPPIAHVLWARKKKR
jgi:hypothetical protein